jgi:hypothetical protein
METTRFPLQSGKPLKKRLPYAAKRTEVILYLRITSSASGRGPDFADFPASGNPVIKPRSFPDIEAETAIAKLPYMHKHSRAQSLFAYYALFANPVKSISNTS